MARDNLKKLKGYIEKAEKIEGRITIFQSIAIALLIGFIGTITIFFFTNINELYCLKKFLYEGYCEKHINAANHCPVSDKE